MIVHLREPNEHLALRIANHNGRNRPLRQWLHRLTILESQIMTEHFPSDS